MQFEVKRKQLDLLNLDETIHNYNLAVCFVMMIVSSVAFTLLGIYLTQVLAASGMRKHPCFCLGMRRGQIKLAEASPAQDDNEQEHAGNFEQVSEQKHEF